MTTAPSPTADFTSTGQATTSDDGPGHGPMAVAMVVVLGSLLPILDMTVVNVALNHLSQGFDAPLVTIQWVATGYTLALATVIPITAWAVGRFGTKRLYMFSIGLFAFGSALAGLAWNAESLIAFRVLQGLGGGMIMPVGMTIIIRAADPERMGRMMSILGIPVLVGPLAGPILGGWLVDDVSWRWIFFINIPIGMLALILAAQIFPRDTPRLTHRLDLPGLLMLSPGLTALIYGLAVGGERSDPGSAGALVPTVLGVVLVTAFVARALTARHPLIDLRLFRRRPFTAAAGTLTLFACAYFGSMLLLPLYYQVVRGQSATASGLLGVPQVMATGITMQIAGRLIDKIAPGRIVLTGVGLASAGFLAFTTQVGAHTPYWVLVGALSVMGVGVGMTMMPTTAAATRNLSHEEVPVASTTLNIIQQVAVSAGTALMSVLLAGAIADRLPATAGSGLGAVHALGARHAIAPRLADAFQRTYGWAVALMLVALLPALLLPRRMPKPAATPADPANRIPSALAKAQAPSPDGS
ncbi:Drug resistance transporter [Carbonactinospora thermoautotrophica]|uniref:Drug resistance transporter n=1 Tax=Carbonactinospora thermoautotrophica TaxID=1469144 RepID=A0A132MTN7_9ACTN|nr:DHA2 family efflux MFS transporter permease subunit [Carbonactinospora thermoautotrophica]KWX01227.1 Drug resistance transporter [Carbonactinospora thermoautotrophica]